MIECPEIINTEIRRILFGESDRPGKGEERIFDAFVILGGRFDEFDIELFCELLTLLLRNGPLVRPVRFVAYENFVHAL
jgi:hypothetical protein